MGKNSEQKRAELTMTNEEEEQYLWECSYCPNLFDDFEYCDICRRNHLKHPN